MQAESEAMDPMRSPTMQKKRTPREKLAGVETIGWGDSLGERRSGRETERAEGT